MKVGDRVRKISGYPFPGVIACIFTTTEGATRVVVECTVPECKGMLHIYRPDQLEVVKDAVVEAEDSSKAKLGLHFLRQAWPRRGIV